MGSYEKHGDSSTWLGVPIPCMKIFEMRQKAESGNVAAQTALGINYLHGINTEVNYEEAIRFLTRAADKGASRAIYNLARVYYVGMGVPRDLARALDLFEAAARAGELLAQIELGRIYSQGLGVLPDHQLAKKWYSAAASQEGSIGDCDKLREAKTFLTKLRHSDDRSSNRDDDF